MECKNCKTELTEMKNDKGEKTCLRCLKCNPLTQYVPPTDKETKYVDIKMSEETVIEIIDRVVPDMIREVLENWHIQKPPVTATEVINEVLPAAEIKPVTWRDEARRLGIRLSQPTGGARKKVDVLADIKAKTA